MRDTPLPPLITAEALVAGLEDAVRPGTGVTIVLASTPALAGRDR
ncbi:hypothetical protein [Phytohabitans suffuscus]|nr:hypothetical protein [Phytohabitans suffuscus]